MMGKWVKALACVVSVGMITLVGGCSENKKSGADADGKPKRPPVGLPTVPLGRPLGAPPEPAPSVDEATPEEAEAAPETPSLQSQLNAVREEFEKIAPAEQVAVFEEGITALRNTGMTAEAASVGDKAPGFELANAQGEPVSLAGLLEHGPVVLAWYRGGWCPYCNVELKALQAALPAIQERGATLVAISPETPEQIAATKERHGLGFALLSDAGNETARAYGLVYTVSESVLDQLSGFVDLAAHNGSESNELPLAATYVLNQEGIIQFAYVDADYRLRAEPRDLLAVLDQLKPPEKETAQEPAADAEGAPAAEEAPNAAEPAPEQDQAAAPSPETEEAPAE